MNYFGGGFGGGLGGGYRDPLSFGSPFGPYGGARGGMGGGVALGGAPMGGGSLSLTNPGGALGRLLGGAGEKIGEGFDWLTDKDRGANRINALFGLASLGSGLYAAHEQGEREDRAYKQEQADRERERQRQAAADPYRQKILAMLMQRYQDNGG